MKKNGIGSHHSAKSRTDEWLSPPWIIEALGKFDLDPCSYDPMPWNIAKNAYCEMGLELTWKGRVWLNPPYGKETGLWLKKLADHGNGIALTFARTETAMFFESVWPRASAILFIKGRLHFHYPDGTMAKANSGAPSCLIAYGSENAVCLEECDIAGKFIDLR